MPRLQEHPVKQLDRPGARDLFVADDVTIKVEIDKPTEGLVVPVPEPWQPALLPGGLSGGGGEVFAQAFERHNGTDETWCRRTGAGDRPPVHRERAEHRFVAPADPATGGRARQQFDTDTSIARARTESQQRLLCVA